MLSGADNRRPSSSAATFRWALLGAFAPKVISPITVLALPIFLEPRAFGLMAASTFVLTAVQMVAGMGAGSTVIQRQGDVEATASFAFWVAVTAGAVAFAATWWAAPLVEGAFHFTGLAAVLRVSAVSLPVGALGGGAHRPRERGPFGTGAGGGHGGDRRACLRAPAQASLSGRGGGGARTGGRGE